MSIPNCGAWQCCICVIHATTASGRASVSGSSWGVCPHRGAATSACQQHLGLWPEVPMSLTGLRPQWEQNPPMVGELWTFLSEYMHLEWKQTLCWANVSERWGALLKATWRLSQTQIWAQSAGRELLSWWQMPYSSSSVYRGNQKCKTIMDVKIPTCQRWEKFCKENSNYENIYVTGWLLLLSKRSLQLLSVSESVLG